MRIEFGFGAGTQAVEFDSRDQVTVLRPRPVPGAADGGALVRAALSSPIGSPRLRELVRPGEKIAVITSDITRPLPTGLLMPELLDELYAGGVRPEDITLVFGLGSHRRQTDAERRALAGERAFREIACVDSDADDTVRLGVTSRGTPVDVTRRVAEADRRICLGNIEYHYFAGYSGGAKALMPGVSNREAIQHNHRFMTDPAACAGRLAGNPVREDIEEAAALCGVDFILNVVLDEHKQIVFAAAGDVTAAHRAGCAFLDGLYMVPLARPADIVLASQGGAPKDLNLYQTQKALDNARRAVRPGGTIILIGSCREGLGEATFEKWMTTMTPEAMIERIGRDFQLGGHKAAAIALVLREAEICLVSELPEELVRRIHLLPFPSAQSAYVAARARVARDGSGVSVAALPFGGSTLPVLPQTPCAARQM